jgi:CHAD domain-containing protein
VQESPVEAVHEARRDIRALRAIVRLLKEGLGDDRYRRESGLLRDAASLLSPHRDTHVVLATFDRLAHDLPDGHGEAASMLRGRLARSEDATLADHAAGTELHLRRFLDSIACWPEACDDPLVVSRGLKRCVRRARRGCRDALHTPTPPHLHELRKRCKDVRDQLRVLAPLKPRKLRKIGRRYDRVCDLLGEGRDMCLLQESLSVIAGPRPFSELMAAEAARRHAELAAEGLRMFAKATRTSGKKLGRVVRERWEAGAF